MLLDTLQFPKVSPQARQQTFLRDACPQQPEGEFRVCLIGSHWQLAYYVQIIRSLFGSQSCEQRVKIDFENFLQVSGMSCLFESGLAMHEKLLGLCPPLQQLVAASQDLHALSCFIFKACRTLARPRLEDALRGVHSLHALLGVSLAEEEHGEFELHQGIGMGLRAAVGFENGQRFANVGSSFFALAAADVAESKVEVALRRSLVAAPANPQHVHQRALRKSDGIFVLKAAQVVG